MNETVAASHATGITRPLSNYLTFYTINIILFYFNSEFALPFAFRIRNSVIWKLPLVVFGEFAGYLLIMRVVQLLLSHNASAIDTHQFSVTEVFISIVSWRFSNFLIISSGYYFLKAFLKSRLAKERAEKQILLQILKEQQILIELSDAKNAYLQARINPHFLFNALNFIFIRSRRTDKELAQAILLLSQMMQYSVDCEQRGGKIPIGEEIEQIKQLFEFWQIREQTKPYLTIDCSPEASEIQFIPLVLLTLTENMLKHGMLYRPGNPASIRIWIAYQHLYIETSNLIKNEGVQQGLNTGLNNIQQRLYHTYGDQSSFECGKNASNEFLVKIGVKLMFL